MDEMQQESGFTVHAFYMRVLIIVGLGIAAIGVALFLPPIPQDTTYHNFADQRSLLGVPNLLNVISNVPFLVIGVLGLIFVLRQEPRAGRGAFVDSWERWPFLVLFTVWRSRDSDPLTITLLQATPRSSGIGCQ